MTRSNSKNLMSGWLCKSVASTSNSTVAPGQIRGVDEELCKGLQFPYHRYMYTCMIMIYSMNL